jgi:hypothetical protein
VKSLGQGNKSRSLSAFTEVQRPKSIYHVQAINDRALLKNATVSVQQIDDPA